MAQPRFWYLRRLQVDQRLPEQALETLEERARLERWGHQADIYRAADDPSVSIVLSGRVWLKGGAAELKVPLNQGDIFGRVLQAEPDSAQGGRAEPAATRLHAWDDTLLAVLDREEFKELVQPHLGRLSTKVGAFRKRRDIWVPVGPLLFTGPAERMAKVLLHLAQTEGEIDAEGRARLLMKREARKLAALTGFNPTRVRKVLEALEVDNILRRAGGELWIRDIDELREVAGELEEPAAI